MNLNKKAKQIFKQHLTIDKVYITSDGFGFTDKDKAEAHTGFLKEKEVVEFTRESIDNAPLDRLALKARYKELTGKVPAKNISTQKLAEQVAELENSKQ